MRKPLHARVKNDLHDIWASGMRAHAERIVRKFGKTYESKRPKTVENLGKDLGRLLTFYDFLGEHWPSIRSTNVVESAFATIRLRTRQARGCNSPGTVTDTVFKLTMATKKNWSHPCGTGSSRRCWSSSRSRRGRQEKEEKDARAA